MASAGAVIVVLFLALVARIVPVLKQRYKMVLADLRKPFDPSKISWRLGATNADKTKGMALAYIDARDVMERLDDVAGLNWQCEYTSMHNGSCCCRIGIKVGDEWIWRSNGALNLADSDKTDAKEMAEKGSYSDAFKRSAVLFGIGRYLYDLDSPWVAIEPAGRSFKIAKPEYARLEAMLAKGVVNTPSKAPTTVPQAQTPTKPTVAAEAYAPASVTVSETAMTPKRWLEIGIDRVKGLDSKGLDEFTEKYHAKIAKLRPLEPALHAKLMDAIKDRQGDLG